MPIIGIAAKIAARKVAAALMKKGAKKASSQQRLERTLRAENRGDARIKSKIDNLRKKEESGIISAGERQRALNELTKSSKEFKSSPGKKIDNIRSQ